MAKSNDICAIGRRKTASARVRIKSGTGKVKVNGKSFEEYFPSEALKGYIIQPLAITNTVGKFDIYGNIRGGGTSGQAGALRHGISRALIKYDESLRPVLKNSGMLTRDAREKERKKPFLRKARKRPQYSKR